jgi:hypothetical protein|tara:strand:- start:3948 stop:4493 length:546 start_codon:yes stop_codon:yes gene_type:complete
MDKDKLMNVSDAMVSSLQLLIDQQTYHTGQVSSVMMSLADRSKLPPELQDHEDKFFNVLERFGVDKDEFDVVPYPVLAVLPENTEIWSDFVRGVAEDTRAIMYAVVTEAEGVAVEAMENPHPDNVISYAVIRVGVNGHEGVTYTAPLQYRIVDKTGDRQRRVGKWVKANADYKLPTQWKGA